ncbi:MAG TPA: hypothetical protein VIU12_08505 [Chryseolinea sp.]
MEKKLIIRFLREKRRGAYSLLVEAYVPLIFSLSKAMALTIIQEDLERESGIPVSLNYFSLARAIQKYKKKHPKAFATSPQPKREFKDASELKDGQLEPIVINDPSNKSTTG